MVKRVVDLHDQGEDAVHDRYSLILPDEGNRVILLFNSSVGGLTPIQVRNAVDDWINQPMSTWGS